MMDLAALVLATAGFAAIALSMHKHHRDLFGRPPSRPRALAFAGAGWALLALSFWVCIVVSGWAIGPVLWIGLLTLAALVIVLALTYGAGIVSGAGRSAPRKATRTVKRADRNPGTSAHSRSTVSDTPRRTDGTRRSATPALRSGQASQLVSQPARCTLSYRPVRLAACVVCACALLSPAAAMADTAVSVELNKLEPNGEACRAYLVVKNDAGAAFETLKLDLVLFDTDGVVARRLAVETAPLPAGKTSLKVFDVAGLSCDGIGRVLLNDILACRDGSGERTDCAAFVTPTARGAVPFIK